MSSPSLVVRQGERDAHGGLLPAHLTEIRWVLRAGGFVLLPSDSAYSVATWMRTARTRAQVNELLDREQHEPISLAFPSVAVVQEWTAKNKAADQLLECFTPGPITVVRTASRLVPVSFTRQLLGSLNHTIGIRVPDSAEERQVADLGTSVITTVPVRNLNMKRKPAVTSFSEAVGGIRDRAQAFAGAPWCAVEGEVRYRRTSTVVEILGSASSYRILRPGPIPEEEIRACIERRRA